MIKVETSAPVMVTGATGYLAGWIIKYLLESGVTVHAAVRDPNNIDKRKHLDNIAANSPGKIKYFAADLLSQGSYAKAMTDCHIVFHTASPFTLQVNDPLKELIEPAKLGTINVLQQACQTPSVKRVILTSSCAAIYGDNKDLLDTPKQLFTEDIWNTSSSIEHNPYSFSKTVAEKEAWKIADNQKQWDLITINPSLVMGPGLNPHASSESFNIIRQMGNGTLKMGVPDWGFGVVDVRDAASAHIAAAYTPQAKGRYIISGHNTSFLQMAQQLLPNYGNQYPIPQKTIPKFIIWLLGPLLNPGMSRKSISRNVGYHWRGSNEKSKKELGMTYRPLSQTMNDFFAQMVETNQLSN